ncbi:MAG: AP2 domain-containing protein [Sedimentisphaerales bacterium]
MKVKLLDWVDGIFAWPVMVYRLLKYSYTYRRIYLGEGQWTILDQEDYCRLRDFKWIVYGTGNNYYAVRHKIVGPNKTWMISMHREIMKPTDDRVVDHKNCNSLDNRRANLRFATRTQNIRNRRKMKNSRSQYIGVYFSKQKGKWETRIMYRRKRIYLGRYDSEIDAAKAYDEAAQKYFGEFARLNFPEQDENSRAMFARIGRLIRCQTQDHS